MKGWNRVVWLVVAVAWALGAQGVRAAGGTISFHGAIVAPTCGFEQMAFSGAASAGGAHGGCGREVATQASSSPYRQVTSALDEAMLSNDRLIGYFTSYADADHVRLVTRTYE